MFKLTQFLNLFSIGKLVVTDWSGNLNKPVLVQTFCSIGMICYLKLKDAKTEITRNCRFYVSNSNSDDLVRSEPIVTDMIGSQEHSLKGHIP